LRSRASTASSPRSAPPELSDEDKLIFDSLNRTILRGKLIQAQLAKFRLACPGYLRVVSAATMKE
jgi:hypothetical protein